MKRTHVTNVQACCHSQTVIKWNVDAKRCRTWNEESCDSPFHTGFRRLSGKSHPTTRLPPRCVTENVITGNHVASAMGPCRDLGIGEPRFSSDVVSRGHGDRSSLRPWRISTHLDQVAPSERLSETVKVFAGIDVTKEPAPANGARAGFPRTGRHWRHKDRCP